jgi:hypothetical protein
MDRAMTLGKRFVRWLRNEDIIDQQYYRYSDLLDELDYYRNLVSDLSVRQAELEYDLDDAKDALYKIATDPHLIKLTDIIEFAYTTWEKLDD